MPLFNLAAEDAADAALDYNPPWVMDGGNQRAILDAFFEPVTPGDSLVFVYLKHSPLQEQRTDRLLVGAARVTRITPPPMWNQSGNPPFSSSMWETIVEHSLRADMTDGILLPYQQLITPDRRGRRDRRGAGVGAGGTGHRVLLRHRAPVGRRRHGKPERPAVRRRGHAGARD